MEAGKPKKEKKSDKVRGGPIFTGKQMLQNTPKKFCSFLIVLHHDAKARVKDVISKAEYV